MYAYIYLKPSGLIIIGSSSSNAIRSIIMRIVHFHHHCYYQ